MFAATGFNQQSIVKDNLVIYLDPNDKTSYPGTGTNWKDLSNINNNFTLYNGVGYSSNNGGYLTFDGADDYVYCTDISKRFGLATIPNGFTVCCVLKPNETSTSDVYTDAVIWGCADGNCLNSYELHKRSGFWGQIRQRWMINFYYNSTSLDLFAITFTMPSSGFNLVQITMGLSGSFFLTVNGEIPTADRLDYGGGIITTNVPATGSVTDFRAWLNNRPEIGIGTGNYGNTKDDIAGFFTYNRALTLQEHKQNYNALKPRFGL